ncbi:meiosis-specific protein MEI4, partial [Biomphalaria glabrata]
YNISWFKLAVASAIIRSKPVNMSSKKYAEELRAAYLRSQTRLQEQYLMAPKQVAELKEIIEKLHCHQMEKTWDNIENYTSQLKITRDLIPFGTSELLKPSANQNEASFVENLYFIQSVITLQNLTKEFTCEETEKILEAAGKSIRNISDIVYRNLMTVSENLLCQAAHNLNVLMDTFQWLQERPTFMREVCLLVDRIVEKLFHSTSHGLTNKYRRKQLLTKMLHQLARSKSLPLLLIILDSLVERVENLCLLLNRSQATQQLVDANLYNNGYFLVVSMELIMKQWMEECPVSTETLQECQGRLDQAILLVKDSFPLVAQAFFRVSSLCEIIIQNR